MRSIDRILLESANCSLRFAWGKRADTQVAYKQAKTLALDAIKDPFDPNREPYTINYQHAQAKSEATRQWEERWHADPRTSLAYHTACTSPPDGRPHPILQVQKKGWSIETPRSEETEQPITAKASHADVSTLFRIITGHAFTGNYTAHFLKGKFPSRTPEELSACPCGERDQTVEHILLDCQLHAAARRSTFNTQGQVRTLNQLFDNPTQCAKTLRFFEDSQACAKPRNADWDPG